MTAEVIRGSRAGVTVRQPEPPQPGELTQTPREIEGPYFRLGAPERSNLLEPGDKPELVLTGRVLNERARRSRTRSSPSGPRTLSATTT